ncbi:ABC transporter substrate-binding protein [Bradyrhizobium sp. 33ap4]|uniref:ABC transporter substrate-binding protein n=1 Tax=Bradyrhizobium sp. 33ap4 TaxID=3061630 RepID=UPI0029315037|nr:ABC transporter substrate-binding protein [Bradyrhizobium sp. 33ap4]
MGNLRLFLFAWIVSFGVHCGQPVLAADKVQALIGVRNMDEAQAPFIVAKYLGYFSREGLDVDLLTVGGSNEIAIQVASGNANLGAASPAQAVIGMQEESVAPLDVRYFYDYSYRNIWSMSVPADSNIRSIADLRGKKIGIPSLGSGGVTYGKAYVRSAGLDPDKDVTFIPIGVGSQAVSAIRQKIVDAIAFWDVANVRFELSGLALRNLDIGENLDALPDLSLLAKNDVIKNNPQMLIGFARAVSKAIDFTNANPAAAVLITWKVYPESRPREPDAQTALAQGLKILAVRSPGWTSAKTDGKNGLFVEEDWKNLSNFLLAGGQIARPVPTSRMYTNDLIGEINNYDRNAIIRQAKEFDLGSVR